MSLNHFGLNRIRMNSFGLNPMSQKDYHGGPKWKEPDGNPPADAVQDSDGYFLVDKHGNYLTLTD